ncbi:MAG: homoserine dehydrogenase [Candidatus Obscuribacterales bacterium]|nr:homoserine dehydrogenase [Cyanobacteria bacterium HKST-UBA01]MCB9469111.1 homoserine dehydrogenase [Candidatus Obscuribacterales bacterium]
MANVVVGMLGLGTVGSGVVKLLSNHPTIQLKKVAVRDLAKAREISPDCELTDNPEAVVNDPEIEVLIEVMGGEQPALKLITDAINSGKHVVTANKEVLAKNGPELFRKAREKEVAIFFEASVAGGVPLISTIQKGLEANQISSVFGILNGTTNFILSKMEKEALPFAQVLKEAQDLGFAEADPTSDVEGFDVAYKLSILTALAFGKFVKPDDIYREGITKIAAEDLEHAAEFGYRIKLLGMAARLKKDAISARVQPVLVPLSHSIASLSGASNGIVVRGDAVGELMMIGPGAGQLPTASAVVGDVVNLATALRLQDFASYFHTKVGGDWQTVQDPDEWQSAYYLRLAVDDHPGVIGRIGTIFGEHEISISSIIQRGVTAEAANVIIVTHPVKTGNLNRALATLSKENFLSSIASRLAIFEDSPEQ